MKTVPRIYDSILAEHVSRYRQMAFVRGPRQVGKTTTCQSHAGCFAEPQGPIVVPARTFLSQLL